MDTTTYLTLHNQHDIPKPFKRVPIYSTSSSGRKRNYKQIIAMEQEANFDLGVGGSSSKSKKKKKKKSTATTNSETVTTAGGGKLVGAAAKAAKRKEERLKREAAAGQQDDSTLSSPTPTEQGNDTPLGEEAEEQEEEDEETKTLRLEQEQERQRKRQLPTFLSVEAPPSLRPAKKYCDVTGLIAPYTDPKTGLRYHSAEIYEIIKEFPPGVDTAYLALRGKVNTLV
ncbi:unnamed protein product [Sympodiomycopsis kandeliae]